jgi:predicted component of type VI protein secretion system
VDGRDAASPCAAKSSGAAVFDAADGYEGVWHLSQDPGIGSGSIKDATANANLAARLPYLFATCRFAHFLKCMVRDKIGSFKERADMERWLANWIKNYVPGNPAAPEKLKARKPSPERR